jgi:aquaporin Z
MIAKIFGEFIGTFVFLSVILATGEAIPIAIALAASIYFCGHLTGGHFNPAVSTMFFAKGSITWELWTFYVVAQVLGGLVALLWWSKTWPAVATPSKNA